MTPLTSIDGLSPEAAGLLNAAGIHTPLQLSIADASRLHSQLELIAWRRGRGGNVPGKDELENWITTARGIAGPDDAEALSMDDIPEAVAEAPYQQPETWTPPAAAAPVPSGVITPRGLPEHTNRPAPVAAAPDNSWRKIDPSRFATIEEYNEGRIAVKPLSRESLDAPPEEEDPEAVSRRPQRIRSKGEDLSRRVRRGVVHPRPVHTWIGALVSLIARIAFVVGIAGFIYLITQVERPADYQTEVIAGATVLLVLGCMQLHFAGRSRCRICSCNLYYSKNCLKNRKAHHIPGIGYVASLALHLLIFGWFRCMYCGTAIRLRATERE